MSVHLFVVNGGDIVPMSWAAGAYEFYFQGGDGFFK